MSIYDNQRAMNGPIFILKGCRQRQTIFPVKLIIRPKRGLMAAINPDFPSKPDKQSQVIRKMQVAP